MILSSHIAIIYPLLNLNKLLKQGKDLNVHRRFGVKYNFKKKVVNAWRIPDFQKENIVLSEYDID